LARSAWDGRRGVAEQPGYRDAEDWDRQRRTDRVADDWDWPGRAERAGQDWDWPGRADRVPEDQGWQGRGRRDADDPIANLDRGGRILDYRRPGPGRGRVLDDRSINDWRPAPDDRPEEPVGFAGSGRRRPRRRRLRRPRLSRRASFILRSIVVILVAFFLLTTWSLGSALRNPGMGSTLAERAAEWARDHYLGPLVTLGEWLTYQPPKVGGKPSFALNKGLAANDGQHVKAHGRAAISALPPARLKPVAGQALPGEGVWRPLAYAHGRPAIWGTFLRPSKIYSSYVAGIVSMNQQMLRFQLRPGAEDPGPGNWHAQSWITPGTRRGLVATFNSGFKIASAGGGFYLHGSTAGTLQRGAASEVYYRNGDMTVGAWDRTVRMTPQVVGVRQNLQLIVSHGKVPASVNYNVESSWGATLGGGYYVWRSGIGVTSTGRIIFAYGPALNVQMLAELLRKAGAVTAMQLDINPEWMSYMYYRPGQHPASPVPHNLLPTQNQPPTRYYSISSRDFTAVYVR
jgi:hypothetical protein